MSRFAVRLLVAAALVFAAVGTAFAGAGAFTPAAHVAQAPATGAQSLVRTADDPGASMPPIGRESPQPTETPEPTATPEALEPAPTAAAAAAPTATAFPEQAVQHALDRLVAAGVPGTADQLRALAAQVGVGGAIRVLAWAHETGRSADEIVAMFLAGKGWGQIAQELGLSNAGLGGVMGNGNGHGHGPGANATASPAAKGNGNGNGHGNH